MKTIIIKAGFVILFLFVMGAGCEDEQDPLCFKGRVISLNNGDGCNNIIEIIETPYIGELAVGTTLTFDLESYGGKIHKGDVVYFKVIQYETWIGPAYANCIWPKYTASLEFCKN
jgi:hypothetical protein